MKKVTDADGKILRVGDGVKAIRKIYKGGGGPDAISPRETLIIDKIDERGGLHFSTVADYYGGFDSSLFVKASPSSKAREVKRLAKLIVKDYSKAPTEKSKKAFLNILGGMMKGKKRRFRKNPTGVLLPVLGVLVIGGIVVLIWKPWKSRSASGSGGGTTLSQAEIASLYQQWLQQKQTNPGGVQGWLNAILQGVSNASAVVKWFNAQKGGPAPVLPPPGQGAG